MSSIKRKNTERSMLKQQNEMKKEIADPRKKNDPNSIITELIPGLETASNRTETTKNGITDIEEKQKITIVNKCIKSKKFLKTWNASRYGRQIIQHKDDWYSWTEITIDGTKDAFIKKNFPEIKKKKKKRESPDENDRKFLFKMQNTKI